ncbi:MAG: hypothetical protein HRT64_12360 [Erythrobacter sp.]|nr:hypothetical protein [Erythrobacter sp.]
MTIATPLQKRPSRFANLLGAACSLGVAASLVFAAPPLEAQNREPSAEAVIEPILERFVADYRQDPLAQNITFGLEVEGMRWRVTSRQSPNDREVSLEERIGDEPMLYFTANRETLNLLDQGVWNGLTAMRAATSADVTPLDILTTEGYERRANYDATIRPLIFDFWTRGTPEIVTFSAANTRVVHGAPATGLYYDRDFPSAVYQVPAGLGRDQAPTLTMPFKRMALVICGSGEGVMGDTSFTMKAGEMILSPPNIPVSFWNASDKEPLSFVWLMWGEGA